MPFTVAAGTACSTVGNTQDRRTLSLLNPTFGREIGRLATVVNGGNQSYNGLLLSVQHKPNQRINVNGNYTWSHCIGDYQARSNNGYGASVDHTYQDPTNRKRDRGNCEIDQRHAFNLTAVGETPRFVNRTLSLIGSGWRLSGIYRLSSSGTIVANSQSSGNRTVTLGSASGSNASATTSAAADRCLCDISGQRPNQILSNVYLDRSGRPNTQWLNPAAFAPPALGTLGNLGRTTLELPAAWQFDVALARTFQVREAKTLEFRAEAYNVMNSFRVGIPAGSPNSAQAIDTNLSSSQFGKVRLALEPRILQFALKYLF
jgi:hypothetical protein